MWIQLPCHLYVPQAVDLGGGGSFSQRNETLKGLGQVNIAGCQMPYFFTFLLVALLLIEIPTFPTFWTIPATLHPDIVKALLMPRKICGGALYKSSK